jgi:hypothetical protein
MKRLMCDNRQRSIAVQQDNMYAACADMRDMCAPAYGAVCEQQDGYQFDHLVQMNVQTVVVFHTHVWFCGLATFCQD